MNVDDLRRHLAGETPRDKALAAAIARAELAEKRLAMAERLARLKRLKCSSAGFWTLRSGGLDSAHNNYTAALDAAIEEG